MNQRHSESTKQPLENDDTNNPLSGEDDSEVGLTDDERVSREDSDGEGARVTPGPADLERAPIP